MPAYPQFWNNAKTAMIISAETGSVVAGNTLTLSNFYLFNDKGASLGGSTLTGAVFIAEFFDGTSWLRYGHAIVDDGWIEVSITGTVDNTGGGISAQTTAYTKLGAGRALAIDGIPQNCGRQFAARVVVPVGASEGVPQWRIAVLYDEVLDPVLLTSVGNDLYGRRNSPNTWSQTNTFNGNTGFGGTPTTKLHTFGTGAQSIFDSGAASDARMEYKRNGTRIGLTGWDTGAMTILGDAGVAIIMYAGNTERLRLASDGNIGINGTSFGGGTKVVYIGNASANPSSNPTAGHILYADAGALKGRGSSGTTTTLAAAEPHCPQCRSDVAVLEAVNHDDRYLFVCVGCLIEDLNLHNKPYVIIDDAPGRSPKRTGQALAAAVTAARAYAKAARDAAKHTDRPAGADEIPFDRPAPPPHVGKKEDDEEEPVN